MPAPTRAVSSRAPPPTTHLRSPQSRSATPRTNPSDESAPRAAHPAFPELRAPPAPPAPAYSPHPPNNPAARDNTPSKTNKPAPNTNPDDPPPPSARSHPLSPRARASPKLPFARATPNPKANSHSACTTHNTRNFVISGPAHTAFHAPRQLKTPPNHERPTSTPPRASIAHHSQPPTQRSCRSTKTRQHKSTHDFKIH